MRPERFPCGFCGSVSRLRLYPTDVPGVKWHACPICVALIREQNWNPLIERIIAAYAALQCISDSEQDAFRHELEDAFRQPLEDEMNVSRTFYFVQA
jgi:hypothetical protein